jgi:DNA-binding response OmpR family regulator
MIKIKHISKQKDKLFHYKTLIQYNHTRKKLIFLEYLMRHPGEVISQEDLLEHVWSAYTNPLSNTIRVHIQSLRKKLGEDSNTQQYIATVIGGGYRFVKPEDRYG